MLAVGAGYFVYATIDAYFCPRAFTVFCVLFTARFKFAFSRRGFGRVKFEAEIYKFDFKFEYRKIKAQYFSTSLRS